MREIVFDTETTGLDPDGGDRVVEIGCIELVNRLPSGERFHTYLNPERDMPQEAEKVHGLTAAFLADKPLFADIAERFLAFIADAPLIAHNADFDVKFINAELRACGRAGLDGHEIIDTLAMARQKFPGAPASLDALCGRFGIDNAARDLQQGKTHGAVLDSELLAAVYLELSGGRQPGLVFEAGQNKTLQAGMHPDATTGESARQPQKRRPKALPPRLSADEQAAHQAFLEAFPQRAIFLAEPAAN